MPQKKFVRTATTPEEKRVQDALVNPKTDRNIMVQDESLFVHDSLVIKKKKWIAKEKRPIVTVTVTGSHSKSIIFGVLSNDGNKQLFRQYDRFDSHSFIVYLEEVKKKFKKVIIFVDRAQHIA